MAPQPQPIIRRGLIGWIAFIIWCIVFGLTMAIPGFAIPAVVLGVWLVIAAILMAVGI